MSSVGSQATTLWIEDWPEARHKAVSSAGRAGFYRGFVIMCDEAGRAEMRRGAHAEFAAGKLPVRSE